MLQTGMSLARFPLLADWTKVERILVKPGIDKGKAQVVICPVPDGDSDQGQARTPAGEVDVDAINEELFG